MKNIIGAIISLLGFSACQSSKQASIIDSKKETWVFLMAGQSNMAGRGLVEAQDTVTDSRILTIDKNYNIIKAREPIHFYEPNLKGVDSGLSFGKSLLKEVDESVTILIIPTAVGGSAIGQWLGDSVHRNVKLMTNFRKKMAFAKTKGIVKGILWHQGESDATAQLIPQYQDNLQKLFGIFRSYAGDEKLPIILGELGAYSKTPDNWNAINSIIKAYVASDPHSALITTRDLKHKGDFIHFDAEGQRLMGQRYADAYLKMKK